MPVMSACVSRRRQRGVGMIEVLVALLVLSIGVLGYAGLQLRALDSTDAAQYRSQAVALANDAIERMRANPGGLYEGVANWPQGPFTNAVPANWNECMVNACAPAAMRDWDIAQLTWLAWNSLPQGRMAVENGCAGAASNACVVVAWDQTVPGACDPTADDCIRLEVRP